MADKGNDDRQTEKTTDDSGKTSVHTERDDGNSVHITTSVDIPDVGSFRSSYDVDKETGEISGQHMTNQTKSDK